MSGGPSHLDLFDYKPELVKRSGEQTPEELVKNVRLAQIGKEAKLLGNPIQICAIRQIRSLAFRTTATPVDHGGRCLLRARILL